MNIGRRRIGGPGGERGSNVAQAAAVALFAAVVIGALLLVAPDVGSAVDRSFNCLIAAISGSGSGGCADGGEAAAEVAREAELEEEDDDCNFFCQVGGVAKGIGEGIVDTATGIGTLAWDGVQIMAGDQETIEKYRALAQAFIDDPLGTTVALGEAMIEPMVTDWQNGNYGEAIGRGIFEAISIVAGPKGVQNVGRLSHLDDVAVVANHADELADVARVADNADELGDVARTVERLPCIGAAPGGKAPGLARPAAEACDLPAMPDEYVRGRTGYNRPDLDAENCVYCGRELTDEPRLVNSIEADHLVGLKDAWERGGRTWTAEEWRTFSNDLENLVASCKSCNASKQAKQLFDQWAPPNITPQARNDLIRRIQRIVERYKLDNP